MNDITIVLVMKYGGIGLLFLLLIIGMIRSTMKKKQQEEINTLDNPHSPESKEEDGQ